MDYSFSLARLSDTPEILKLYRSLMGMPSCTWNVDSPNREIVEADINTESLYIVSDKKYKIVAVATICKKIDWDELTCWKTRNPCDLARFGISIEKQNQEIGSFLLRKIISTARRNGFDGTRLLVSKDNLIAQKMYQQQGFKRVGEKCVYSSDFECFELFFLV